MIVSVYRKTLAIIFFKDFFKEIVYFIEYLDGGYMSVNDTERTVYLTLHLHSLVRWVRSTLTLG